MRILSNVAEVDLRHLEPHSVYRLIQWTTAEPAGTSIVFRVSPNQIPEYGALDWLRAHGRHLSSVGFRCPDSGTRQEWHRGLAGKAGAA